MKQVIYVTTTKEALRIARSIDEAVMVAFDNFLYKTFYIKEDYEERVKRLVLERLEALCNEADM